MFAGTLICGAAPGRYVFRLVLPRYVGREIVMVRTYCPARNTGNAARGYFGRAAACLQAKSRERRAFWVPNPSAEMAPDRISSARSAMRAKISLPVG